MAAKNGEFSCRWSFLNRASSIGFSRAEKSEKKKPGSYLYKNISGDDGYMHCDSARSDLRLRSRNNFFPIYAPERDSTLVVRSLHGPPDYRLLFQGDRISIIAVDSRARHREDIPRKRSRAARVRLCPHSFARTMSGIDVIVSLGSANNNNTVRTQIERSTGERYSVCTRL